MIVLVPKFVDSPPFLYFLGSLRVLIGLAIVLAHAMWVGTLGAVVIVIGWVTLLRGIATLLLPVETEPKILAFFSRGNAWYTTASVAIVLGGRLADAASRHDDLRHCHVKRKFAGQRFTLLLSRGACGRAVMAHLVHSPAAISALRRVSGAGRVTAAIPCNSERPGKVAPHEGPVPKLAGCLSKLGLGVHHDRSVPRDGSPMRFPRDEQKPNSSSPAWTVTSSGTVTVTHWLGTQGPYSVCLWISSHTAATAFRASSSSRPSGSISASL